MTFPDLREPPPQQAETLCHHLSVLGGGLWTRLSSNIPQLTPPGCSAEDGFFELLAVNSSFHKSMCWNVQSLHPCQASDSLFHIYIQAVLQ